MWKSRNYTWTPKWQSKFWTLFKQQREKTLNIQAWTVFLVIFSK